MDDFDTIKEIFKFLKNRRNVLIKRNLIDIEKEVKFIAGIIDMIDNGNKVRARDWNKVIHN